jgi:aminoglycoside 6'-N-acetyltransferase I
MTIRPIQPMDKTHWLRMRPALWPDAQPSHEGEIERFFRSERKEPEAVLVVELDGQLKGFVELSIRPYAEGCVTDNVAYLEGWYVDEDVRGQGVGRALVEAAESWARSKGCREFASDTELDNHVSAQIHKRLGFEEVGRLRCFRKSLE